MSNRVVLGCQWGDEGKAKVVDYLTSEADIVVRFQGGANAGHTVEVGDEKFIFHLVPSGIMHDDKSCVIGNGVVLEPQQLLNEIDELIEKGIDPTGRLFISDCAHVVFPYHKLFDSLKEKAAGKGAIGTTGRGIGPAYVDKCMRSGLRICDMMDPKIFRNRLENALSFQNEIFTKVFNGDAVSPDSVIEEYTKYAERLKPYVTDTVAYLNNAMSSGKKLLFEGAQGTFLDVDHGTVPFVTSSNTVAGSACVGAGVGPKSIDQVVGVVKAYTTRVGNGPFPTELSDDDGEELQKVGNEFGATTGRRRRCGWFDAVLLRKAAMVNGLTHVAITKIDVMDQFKEIKICTEYRHNGRSLDGFPSQTLILDDVEPVYETMPGWQEKTAEITNWNDLPDNAKKYLKRLSELIQVPIGMISVGPKRHQTISIDI